MQSFTPLLVGFAGAVIGYIICFILQKKQVTASANELAETRKKLEELQKKSANRLDSEKSKLATTEKKLTEATDRINALESQKEQQKSQLKQLQASIQETEAARVKAAANAETQATARQQLETRFKQAEAIAAQSQETAAQLEAHLQSAKAEIASLKENLESRNKQMRATLDELNALRQTANEPSLSTETIELFAQANGSLEGILKILMESEGQNAAVLADNNGIVIAAAGDKNLKDGIAATSQLVGSIAAQLVGMVPFVNVRSYILRDEKANVIAGRAFFCAGQTIGLTTWGARAPSERLLDSAMANLSAALG